jgi:hypothetical protein
MEVFCHRPIEEDDLSRFDHIDVVTHGSFDLMGTGDLMRCHAGQGTVHVASVCQAVPIFAISAVAT